MKFVPALLAGLAATSLSVAAQTASFATRETVGRLATNRWYTPVNQILTPAGRQVELPKLRPQTLALSPDGRLLVTAGKTAEIVVLDPVTGAIRQRVALPAEAQREPAPKAVSTAILQPDKDGQVSFTGLVFSPDGTRLYLANVNGSIKVFAVAKGVISGLATLPLPHANAPDRKAEIPAGLALSPDGKRLYVCGNLSNRLLELDPATGAFLRAWEVGFAPYDVVLGDGQAYVSNWGGRRPEPDSLTGPAGRGTLVRVDPVRHIASEGSVSIISLAPVPASGLREQASEILTGLHASALALTPNGRHLVVANAGSDTLSVVDTRTRQIVETIWTRQNPADLFGAQPNALAFDKSGKRLFVCNGTQNAVAVIEFSPGESKPLGLIPVGWFPGAVIHDAKRNQLYVANIKGLPTEKGRAKTNAPPGFNSHQYHGSLTLLPVPSKRELAAFTDLALANLRYPLLRQAAQPPRPDQPARPVPERVGEPSVFKHVVYIIKENRTYDQVLGDDARGNGDPELCIFGERITPNQHKLVREFVLLDNTYCSGILSADGHQWSTTAMSTDYMEKSFAGFPRSYPDGMGDDEVDALAYSPTGFLWDNVIAHGKTLRNYGEFAITRKQWLDPARKGKLKWLDHWRDYTNATPAIRIYSDPAVETLRPYLATNYVGWDMDVPDMWRADRFLAEFREYERKGNLPHLILICLPNDHTSGTAAGSPTPAAYAADNDLAFGRIIEAISRSRFWPETCIFGIEDDPQNGWDHVSGYRTTAYVVSPYTKRGAVISTQYNTTSVLRTMELMLGLPPMNQMDATATPMSDCFTDTPDFTPYAAVPNHIPLDQMNPPAKTVSDALLRQHAYASARLPLDRVDQCPEDQLNRILWHAMKGSAQPYPEWAVAKVEDDD